MLRGINSANYGEVNVSVSGGYVLEYAGGTRAGSCFISVTLKSWSGRKLLDPTTWVLKKWQRKLCTGAFWLRTEAIGFCCKSDMILLIALNIGILRE
jgi:hypothetical protein